MAKDGWSGHSRQLHEDLIHEGIDERGAAGHYHASCGWQLPRRRRADAAASGGEMADLNGDRFVCTLHFRSMDGDTLRVTVDNDVPTPDSAWVELPYVFNG